MAAPISDDSPESNRDTVLASLRVYGEQTDEALEAFVRSLEGQGSILGEATRYSLGLGVDTAQKRGKRLRPALCLLSAEALGASPERALPFAIAIELMHNFALVHDDIEDGDEMRRQQPAVWVKYGTAHGINTGDYLLTQVFGALLGGDADISAEKRIALIQLMVDTLAHTIRGQAMDIQARENTNFTMEDYLAIVREKTGYYLAAPLQGGAIMADADANVLKTLGDLGQVLGPLFQIRDDVIDLSSGKGREARGNDIREGKRSFLVAWALKNLQQEERASLLYILDQSREETSPVEVEAAIALFTESGALDAANARIAELGEEAERILKQLPASLSEKLSVVFDWLQHRDT